MPSLLFLIFRRLVNSLRRALRTPRLLFPALLILLFLGLQFVLFFSMPERSSAGATALLTDNALLTGQQNAFLATIRGLLLLTLFTTVITTLGEGNLFFEPGDVDFLFPSPLPRRGILLFKMAGKYLRIFVPALFPITFANLYLENVPLNHWGFVPGVIGTGLFYISLMNFSQTLLLSRRPVEDESEEKHNRIRRALRFLLLALLGTGGVSILASGLSASFLLRQFYNFATYDLGRFLPDAWAADLFHLLFEPWHWADAARLFGLILLAAGSFVALFARERDFYESALELSARRTRLRAAIQAGDAGTLLSQMAREGKLAKGQTLPDFGTGMRAVLWKDFVSATRIPVQNWLQLLIPAALPALLGGMLGAESGRNLLSWTLLFTIQMPGIFLLTLRDMLRRADISRSLPISPLKLLLGELLLPYLQLVFLGGVSLTLVGIIGLWRGPFLWLAVLILPSLSALLFMAQAIFVLIYPNPTDPAQHTVSGLLSLLISLLALLPALLVGIPLFLLEAPFWLLVISLTAINLVGATIALFVTAALWQRFDPTE